MQILAEGDESKLDFDILDATKLWPEDLLPVRRMARAGQWCSACNHARWADSVMRVWRRSSRRPCPLLTCSAC